MVADKIIDFLDRPIAFHRLFVTITGSISAALMLSQALYWSKKTTDPDGWFYKTMLEWEEETALSEEEQATARKKLRKSGFWVEERRGLPAKLFFKINLSEFRLAIFNCKNSESSFRESRKQYSGNHGIYIQRLLQRLLQRI